MKSRQPAVLLILCVMFFMVLSSGCFEKNYRFAGEFGTMGSGPGELMNPTGIVCDSEGNVFVVDTGNNRICKFNDRGEYLLSFGSKGNGELQFDMPTGISIDSTGILYIADTLNDRVQKVTTLGAFAGSIFTTSRPGERSVGHLKRPRATAVGPNGKLYIVDESNRVLVYDRLGSFLNAFGSQGTKVGQFQNPMGIAVTPNNSIYVVDTYNLRIQKFNEELRCIYEVKDKGLFNFLKDPRGICALADNSFIVADTGRIPVAHYSSAGVFLGKAGTYGKEKGKILNPGGVAVSPNQNKIYVTDTLGCKVLMYYLK